MHLRHTLPPFLLIALSLQAPAARAQDPDSVVFRRGQWGTEFTIGSGFAAAGVLRFRSPTRAFLVDVGADYGRRSNSSGSVSSSADDVGVALRLGARAYRSLGQRLYRMVTVGITANYSWHAARRDTSRAESEGYGGGVFADIGATWLVTPHLGIGAKFGATLAYTRSDAGRAKSDWLRLSLGDVTLAGQLYF